MLVDQILLPLTLDDHRKIIKTQHTTLQGHAVRQIDGNFRLILSGTVQDHVLYIVFAGHLFIPPLQPNPHGDTVDPRKKNSYR